MDDKQTGENFLSKQSQLVIENLIKRLHQLFTASFDPKSFDLYIEPQVKDRDTGVGSSAFKCLGTFVVQPNTASMLLAGDPGMGKTLLSQQIAQHAWYLFIQENRGGLLKDNYWVGVLADYERQGFEKIVAPLLEVDEKSDEGEAKNTSSLPLWMWMPFLRTEKNWERQLLETHLKQSGFFPKDIDLLKHICQQRILPLLPIMDGWDELPPIKENLYLLSGFWEKERWPYLKVLSTCRPEAFVHYEKIGGYKSVFHPREGVGTYTILDLCAFEPHHITDYVNRYVSTLPDNYQPLVVSRTAEVTLKQIRAWDNDKAVWLKDYETYYFLESPVAGNVDEPVEEKKDDDVIALPEQPTDWQSAATYEYHLGHLSGLRQLVQTPFILSAVVQVLPRIVMQHIQQGEQSQQAITRYTIYQYFVDDWLTTQAKRLWRDPKKQLDLIDFRSESDEESIQKLKACLFTYSENLARLALNLGGGKIEVNLSEKDTLNPNLVIPSPAQSPHFEKEPVPERKLQLIRSGCLLQNLGHTFKFLHKSLVEFFAAKTLFSGVHIAANHYLQRFHAVPDLNKDFSLNEQLLTSEPNIIRLLADQARYDRNFKYLLYQIIELSKVEPEVEKAAANAITILNVAGESFSARDFRGVHIRGAILNGALCDQTNFEGADLRDITAHNAWFQKANMSHAEVSGFDFQELARIKHSTTITSVCVASTGEWLLFGDTQGCVTKYDYSSGKQLAQWNLQSDILGLNVISALALHPAGKLVACGGDGGSVQLIDLQEGKLGSCFTPPVVWNTSVFLQENLSQCVCATFCHSQGQYLAFSVAVDVQGWLGILGRKIEGNHLQIWEVKSGRLLGEYTGDPIKQLATCNQGYTLIADTVSHILLFSLEAYTKGFFTPTKILERGGYFSLSKDEQLLALSGGGAIHLYETHNWGQLGLIPLKEEQICQSIVFSPEGELLVGKSLTQLHVWDLSSRQHLYSLPIPHQVSIGNGILCVLPSKEVLQVSLAGKDTFYIWPLVRPLVSYLPHSISLATPLLEKTKIEEKFISTSFSIESKVEREARLVITLKDNRPLVQEIKKLSYEYYLGKIEGNAKLSLDNNQRYLLARLPINFEIKNNYFEMGEMMGKFLGLSAVMGGVMTIVKKRWPVLYETLLVKIIIKWGFIYIVALVALLVVPPGGIVGETTGILIGRRRLGKTIGQVVGGVVGGVVAEIETSWVTQQIIEIKERRKGAGLEKTVEQVVKNMMQAEKVVEKTRAKGILKFKKLITIVVLGVLTMILIGGKKLSTKKISNKGILTDRHEKSITNQNATDGIIHVWDLEKNSLHFTVKHADPQVCFLFSADGQWLVSASKKIFIHQLADGKKLATFSNKSLVSVVALNAGKTWLAVADYSNSLSIFDVDTQMRLFCLNRLPILIEKLDITIDSNFLVAKDKKEGVLTFRVIQEKGCFVSLRLLNSATELNLLCDEINMEGARGMSKDMRVLLEQNNAHGTPATVAQSVLIPREKAKKLAPPHLVESSSRFRFSAERGERASVMDQSATAAPPETKESEHEEQIDIGREFSFDSAVIPHSVDSFLNRRAGLSYSLWQVALVRDAQSKSNSEHTFILVEGMDAFGRCFFWRFDLATQIRNEQNVEEVQKGSAKVVMETKKYNNLMLSEREKILQVFLNPHEIHGRGLESLVGHIWQLKREAVLDLYRAIAADKAKGLLPYAGTGNQSFFGGGGDNCYSWARRHLLALQKAKIRQDLPSSVTDYIGMRPKWKLQESLVSDQHVPDGGSTPVSPSQCQFM